MIGNQFLLSNIGINRPGGSMRGTTCMTDEPRKSGSTALRALEPLFCSDSLDHVQFFLRTILHQLGEALLRRHCVRKVRILNALTKSSSTAEQLNCSL